jgi:hypothetical protein
MHALFLLYLILGILFERRIDQPINQSTNQPTNQSINQSIAIQRVIIIYSFWQNDGF